MVFEEIANILIAGILAMFFIIIVLMNGRLDLMAYIVILMVEFVLLLMIMP